MDTPTDRASAATVRRLRWRYIPALAIIAALVLVNAVTLHLMTDGMMAEGARIDAAGRQRALATDLSRERTEFAAAVDTVTASLASMQHEEVRVLRRVQWSLSFVMLAIVILVGWLILGPDMRRLVALLATQHRDNARLAALTAQQQRDALLVDLATSEMAAQNIELRRHEQELEAQREALSAHTRNLGRLSAIMDATPDPVAVYSMSGELEYGNAAALALLQLERGTASWRPLYRAFSGWAGRQLRDTSIPYAIEHGVWQGESELRGTAEETRPVLQTVIAHYDADGRPTTISSVLHDLTDQKRLQLALAEREARYRTIIESLAEGVIVQDRDGTIVASNESAERILGLTADQLAGRRSMHPDWRAVTADGDPIPGEQHPVSRARLTGEHVDGELMGIYRGNGSYAWLSVNARPMYMLGEHRAGAVVTFTDITAQRAIARELETLLVVAQQSDHAVITTDAQSVITWANAAAEALTGYSLADVRGKRPSELVHGPHTDPLTVAAMRSAVREGRSFSGEVLNYHKNGTPYWIELTITPLSDARGLTAGFVSLSRDITARRTAERERNQLAAALAVTADGIAITSVGGTLEFANHSFARMHGRQVTDLLATPWSALYRADEAKRLALTALPEVTTIGFWQGEATGLRQDGTEYPEELSLTLLPHGGLVTIARDVSDRHAIQRQLEHLTMHDELTGLYNRRGFLAQAQQMSDLTVARGMASALFYGDLDQFKRINDEYGHQAGDQALIEMSRILRSVVRNTDLVARLGGDEFTIFALGASPDDAAALLERMEAATVASNLARSSDPATNWVLGLSMGVAYVDPEKPHTIESLLRAADEAQYAKKRLRRSTDVRPRAA